MSPWLRPRLLALFCAATLVGGATYLHAQNDYGPPAKTPEDAALNFYRLLDLVRQPQNAARYEYDQQRAAALAGSIERAQFQALSSQNQSSEKFINVLAQSAVAQPYDAQVQSSSAGQTIVSVAPSTKPRSREVVVVPEDGGFRVDVVATYARWNGLSGLDADKALYRDTGFFSPALAALPGYLGASTLRTCQSNERQIGLGIAQYTQDYDERFPPARKWIDVLQPYVKSEQIFKCPALTQDGNGYAFNSKLSQISLSGINNTAQTINIYETSNLGRNVFAPFNGRAYRHQQNGQDGMNIGFADGHVKWFAQGKPANITTNPTQTTPGFVTISGELNR